MVLGAETVEAVYADRETAPVSAQCRAALKLVETMTLRPEELGPVDVKEVRDAGVSDEAIVDAAAVSALFNLIDRVADSVEFADPGQAGYDASARFLLKVGYAFPKPLTWFAPE